MFLNFMVNSTKSFDLIEIVVGIIKIITFSTIIIQALVQYFISYNYYMYYKIPTKYFSRLKKKDFFESIFLLFSFLVLFFFVANFIIFYIVFNAEKVIMIKDISTNKIKILIKFVYLTVSIFFIRFPSFLYSIIIGEKLNSNCNNSIAVIKELLKFLLKSFGILIFLIIIKCILKWDYFVITLYIIVYIITIIFFISDAFFISFGNVNPKLNKEFEIFSINKFKFANIYDYGDSVLAVKIKLCNDKIILKLDNYFVTSKMDKKFKNILVNNVVREKEGKKIKDLVSKDDTFHLKKLINIFRKVIS